MAMDPCIASVRCLTKKKTHRLKTQKPAIAGTRRPNSPDPSIAWLRWLNQYHPGGPWLEALRIAGFAPLAAVEAVDFLETSNAMARDFAAVIGGRISPLDVAGTWSKIDPYFVLDWLSRQIQMAIQTAQGGANGAQGLAIGNSVLQRIDTRNLFCYLDTINRLRGQPGGSWNVQLTFEGLLIDWATGLDKRVME